MSWISADIWLISGGVVVHQILKTVETRLLSMWGVQTSGEKDFYSEDVEKENFYKQDLKILRADSLLGGSSLSKPYDSKMSRKLWTLRKRASTCSLVASLKKASKTLKHT